MMNEFEKASIIYHDIFGFPLKSSELTKWRVGKQFPITNSKFIHNSELSIEHKGAFFFLKGRENTVKQRLQNEKISISKLKIAKKAAAILSRIPTVKMIAVTGSLAMMNSSEDGDIDLLIITRQNTLWTSRLLILLILFLLDMPVRRSNDNSQKDKLCLNVWLDENDLIWPKKDRNIYTAHEIAQIVPLVNKDRTYEKFLFENKWILNYWPNVVKIRNPKSEIRNKFEFSKFKYLNIVLNFVLRTSNLIAFEIQYQHMKSKMTRETVTRTRALFHPHDWGKVVLNVIYQKHLNMDNQGR